MPEFGWQVPRICSAPEVPAGLDSGREAFELAASVGLHLDPWQRMVLERSMVMDGDRFASFEVGVVVGRQNGKGAILEARELWGLFLGGERLILHSAHEFKTSSEAFLRIASLVEGSDALRRRCKKPRTSHGEEQIETLSGNRLRFIARNSTSGRGFTTDCVILDEAMVLSDAAKSALLPTMMTRPNPQLWYTASAGFPTSEALAAVRRRGIAGAPKLAYFEWSVDPEAYDPADREGWAQANPGLGRRVPVEFIERMHATLTPVEFAREHLGVGLWPAEFGDTAIPMQAWDACRDDQIMADPVAFAVDVTPDRSSAAVGVSGRGADGLLRVEVADTRPGVHWVVDRVVELCARWRPVCVAVDPGGPAGSLLPDLRDAGIDPVLLGTAEVKQAAGAFYDDVMSCELRHRGQPELDGAVRGATRRPVGDAWMWDRRAGADICPLVAVTHARHAFAVHGGRVYDLLSSVW